MILFRIVDSGNINRVDTLRNPGDEPPWSLFRNTSFAFWKANLSTIWSTGVKYIRVEDLPNPGVNDSPLRFTKSAQLTLSKSQSCTGIQGKIHPGWWTPNLGVETLGVPSLRSNYNFAQVQGKNTSGGLSPQPEGRDSILWNHNWHPRRSSLLWVILTLVSGYSTINTWWLRFSLLV